MDANLGSPSERFDINNEDDVRGAVMLSYSEMMSRFNDAGLATQIATCISELAMNIVKYAQYGELYIHYQSNYSIEIIAEDRGPGIANIEQAMQDHFSSKGTLGLGLPGVKRMVDEFEIQSKMNHGTRIRVKKWINQY
ncbi:anti-sigma regulatory factor [uncultured Deefgea sp.]|uniref:anti-sigma regulatory factor n=1 Tax=uncultured Deefgea sp. TaxID=1304914 RepID=UPI00259734B7|nr:anti-sigma regulatory factor [uncultured Deefgea sp.]